MRRTALDAVSWQRTDNPIAAALGGFAAASDSGCHAVVTPEPSGLHISVSHPDRYPTWDELASARDAFGGPDRRMVMHFPPRAEYVNVHATTLHLWEADR